LGVVKGFGRMRQELVPPLIIQGLAALVLGPNFGHRLALKALEDDDRFGLGIPFSSCHG
jgi:hypothetical protein